MHVVLILCDLVAVFEYRILVMHFIEVVSEKSFIFKLIYNVNICGTKISQISLYIIHT